MPHLPKRYIATLVIVALSLSFILDPAVVSVRVPVIVIATLLGVSFGLFDNRACLSMRPVVVVVLVFWMLGIHLLRFSDAPFVAQLLQIQSLAVLYNILLLFSTAAVCWCIAHAVTVIILRNNIKE